jgi:hypothetical protein
VILGDPEYQVEAMDSFAVGAGSLCHPWSSRLDSPPDAVVHRSMKWCTAAYWSNEARRDEGAA